MTTPKRTFKEMKHIIKEYIDTETFKDAERNIKQMIHEIKEEC